jgi:hypothetical protein
LVICTSHVAANSPHGFASNTGSFFTTAFQALDGANITKVFTLGFAFGFACVAAFLPFPSPLSFSLPSLPIGPGRLLLHHSRPLLPVVGLLEQNVL